MKRRILTALVISLLTLLFGQSVATATIYYSTYGQSRTETVNLTSYGPHTFEVDAIAWYKYTEWYVNGVYQSYQDSGFFAIDPDYVYTFPPGSTQIKALVYDSTWTYLEYHVWNVTRTARHTKQPQSCQRNDPHFTTNRPRLGRH